MPCLVVCTTHHTLHVHALMPQHCITVCTCYLPAFYCSCTFLTIMPWTMTFYLVAIILYCSFAFYPSLDQFCVFPFYLGSYLLPLPNIILHVLCMLLCMPTYPVDSIDIPPSDSFYIPLLACGCYLVHEPLCLPMHLMRQVYFGLVIVDILTCICILLYCVYSALITFVLPTHTSYLFPFTLFPLLFVSYFVPPHTHYYLPFPILYHAAV